MTITQAPPEGDRAQDDGAELAAFLVGLVDLQVFYETHPGAPRPPRPVLSIRVPAAAKTKLERIAAVQAIAEALGVTPVWRNGVLYAAREFGPLLLECHYTPDFDLAHALNTAAAQQAAGAS